MHQNEQQNEPLQSAGESVYEVRPEGSVLFVSDTDTAGEERPPELANPITQPVIESPLTTKELPGPHSPVLPKVIRIVFGIFFLLVVGIASGIGLRSILG